MIAVLPRRIDLSSKSTAGTSWWNSAKPSPSPPYISWKPKPNAYSAGWPTGTIETTFSCAALYRLFPLAPQQSPSNLMQNRPSTGPFSTDGSALAYGRGPHDRYVRSQVHRSRIPARTPMSVDCSGPVSPFPGCPDPKIALDYTGQGDVIEAGVDGSRTHQGLFCTTPRTVLKTARDTGRVPPPHKRYTETVISSNVKRVDSTQSLRDPAGNIHLTKRWFLGTILPLLDTPR